MFSFDNSFSAANIKSEKAEKLILSFTWENLNTKNFKLNVACCTVN